MGYWNNEDSIDEMIGKTPVKIDGGNIDDCEMTFTMSDGSRYQFYHYQDCCETVNIADVVGDLEDLIGNPLLIVEERSNKGGEKPEGYIESYTWTYYEFATNKGSVTVRWLGESNGYYSESVDFKKIRGSNEAK